MEEISGGSLKMRWICLVICLLFVGPAYAQLDRGTISGTVLDPSGGAIPGATVTITAAGTNVSHNAVTNEHGQYNMPNLPIGTYSIKYEATGFKVLVRENITLQISQVLRIDVRMEVGIAADVVNVTAEAPLVQTDTPEVGTTVTRSY